METILIIADKPPDRKRTILQEGSYLDDKESLLDKKLLCFEVTGLSVLQSGAQDDKNIEDLWQSEQVS